MLRPLRWAVLCTGWIAAVLCVGAACLGIRSYRVVEGWTWSGCPTGNPWLSMEHTTHLYWELLTTRGGIGFTRVRTDDEGAISLGVVGPPHQTWPARSAYVELSADATTDHRRLG